MITKIKFKSSFKYMYIPVKHFVSGYTGILEIIFKNDKDPFSGGKLKIENFTFNGGLGISPFKELDIPPMELNQQKKFKIQCEPLPSSIKPLNNAKLYIVLRDKENKQLESKTITMRFLDEEKTRKEMYKKTIQIITILSFSIAAITLILRIFKLL